MSATEESPRARVSDSAVPRGDLEGDNAGVTGPTGGLLDRFPEAVAAAAAPAAGPGRHGGAAWGFRALLYSALAIGAVAGLSLLAVWILQGILIGAYLRAGGEYFGLGLGATATRELLNLPVTGFVTFLLLCFAGICVGGWGIQRSRPTT